MLIPRPFRKLAGVFRGQVSPTFILLSTALGFWFGLTPGWYGVHVVLLIVTLVLNVHLGVFILSAALGKALCYAAAPLLYHVGCWGQANLAGLYGLAGSVPILGITDFNRCAVAGALLLGPVVGLALGAVLAGAVLSFRRTWLRLEDGSETFRKWQQKAWVRWLDWLLLGKRAADARTALQKKGHIICLPGVILAAVVVLASGVGLRYIGGDALRGRVADQLTKANGAEVGLAGFDLDVFRGRVSAQGIQVTDPAAPTHDRVRIDSLTADVGLWGLLCGRLIIDEVALGGVAFDAPRETPGKLLVAAPPPAAQEAAPAFDPTQFAVAIEDVARLAEYFRKGADVTRKLADAADWLPERKPKPPAPPPPPGYLEYLTARGATTPAPFVVVRRAELDDVHIPLEEVGRSRITCLNLSDAPGAAGLPVIVRIESKDRPTRLMVTCHYDREGGGAELDGTIADVDLKSLQERLNPNNPVRFEGGTAQADLSGRVTREEVDVRLAVGTRDMRASAAGQPFFGLDPRVAQEAVKVLSNVKTTLRVIGSTRDPRLVFDVAGLKDEFKTALVDAGKQELVNRLDEALGDKLPEGVPGAGEVLKDPLEGGRKTLEGFLGGKKRDPE